VLSYDVANSHLFSADREDDRPHRGGTHVNRNHRYLSFGLLVAALCAAGVAWAEATPTPGSGLLAPDNHVLI